MRWIGIAVLTMASTLVLALGDDWVSIEQSAVDRSAFDKNVVDKSAVGRSTHNGSSGQAKPEKLNKLNLAVGQTFAASQPPKSPGNHQAQMRLLLDELDILKQELQSLRELTERQGYELRSLKNESKERYLDLDQRLSGLLGNQSDVELSGKVDENTPEREEYHRAFALLKKKQFSNADAAFSAFIKRFPKGKYAANAYYWRGELFLLQRKYEEARKAFTVVLNQYSSHQKVPDALYKLGVSYERLGRNTDAIKALKRVEQDYGDQAPTTARLAKEYLAKHLKG